MWFGFQQAEVSSVARFKEVKDTSLRICEDLHVLVQNCGNFGRSSLTWASLAALTEAFWSPTFRCLDLVSALVVWER